MRMWRNCTCLHSVRSSPSLLRNKQITSVSRLKSLVKGEHCRYWVSRFSRGCYRLQRVRCIPPSTAMEKHRRGSRSGRTLRGSSSSAGRPWHESSIAKNYLKSRLIEKNCLRSSSTWTGGVHWDKKVSQIPKSRNRTGTRLPECTTRLPSCHTSWRVDWSSEESATNQAPLSSTGSVVKMHGSAPGTHL